MAAKPTPKPGVNNYGRTPQEQKDYEQYQKMTKKVVGPSLLEEWLAKSKNPKGNGLKKSQTYKVMPGSPNMAIIAKKAALKNKAGK